jgi:hypothetical protein
MTRKSGLEYRRLSLADKQAEHRDRMREPAVICPVCEAQTGVTDLLTHVESRCTGPRDPHPQSRWVSWRQAIDLGASRMAMGRWIQKGLVRFRGDRLDRQYLLRDVVKQIVPYHRRKSRSPRIPSERKP